MKDKFDHERRAFEQKFIKTIKDQDFAAWRQQIFEAESNLKTVRKGEINDWKSLMTEEQSQQIYQRFIETCRKCDGLENYWSKWNVFTTNLTRVVHEQNQNDSK